MKCLVIHFILLSMEPYTHTLTSWIPYDPQTEIFPIQNLPFGVFSNDGENFRCATRISNTVIDLSVLEQAGLLEIEGVFKYSKEKSVFDKPQLNDFIALGRDVWRGVRARLQQIFKVGSEFEKNEHVLNALLPLEKIKLKLPISIGDYTDFYSSKNHAYNMGKIIRGEKNAMQPNWYHLPVAYHGRSSTVIIDGTPIKRPSGQVKAQPDKDESIFSASRRLDYEVEMGAIVAKSNKMGENVKVSEANDFVFGFVLLNDWSARDIQTWEYVPLGPFTAKNFATTISPWIVTLEALEPFKVELPKQDPVPLPYLRDPLLHSWDIPITTTIATNNKNSQVVSETNYKYMYWSVNQQIAHHTVTGCKLNVGDLLGSGTISGTESNSFGSMFELSEGGKKSIKVGSEERVWLQDGDYVNFTAIAKGDGYNIGFGNCGGVIVPANPESSYY